MAAIVSPPKCVKCSHGHEIIMKLYGSLFHIIAPIQHPHYSDVIMSLMASQITGVTIVYSTVVQAKIKEIIKAPRHWLLWGEFTDDRLIPHTKGQ